MEREMIQKEIDHLNRSVKHLSTHYKLIERIGYGTFGTVYKAKDLQNKEISNSTTCDHSPPSLSSSSNDKTEFVALKHIYSLSSPQRMGHEIKVLHELRGASCVAPLISAFRQDDNIFMVMPYFEHDDFRDCYRNMSMLDIKHYFISLLTALKNIHKKSIIHRDVKPNNFLYNMKLKTGMLIDFGLAQKEASDLPKSVRSTYHSLVKENTLKSFKPFESTSVFSEFLNGIKPTKPGYFRNDYREHAKGNRGGTRGFRAPEVLLRVKHQTVSIDIWSVGVILLSVLTGRYPFFVAQDEGDSLLEFANIFGLKEMKECAALYNRTFDTNIETLPKTRISLRKLCQVLNTEKFKLWTKENKEDILNALNLLEKLLTLDYTERITAEEALMHPFLIL
ncbi:kinase-like domain-containing protein [Cunninghamella echinulata]|nr:kinase-like domain-containing protein [Cunninghamella echinulata]